MFALLFAACARRDARHATPATPSEGHDVAVTVRPGRPRREVVVTPRSSLVIPPSDGGTCVSDEQCGDGRCFNANLEAQYSRVFRDCGDARAWRDARRRGTCVAPACTSDEGCPAGTRCGTLPMVPFPQRVCLPAACRSDAACMRDGAHGQCVPFLAGRPCEHGGWSCSYADDPCSPLAPTRRCRPVDGVVAYCIPVNGRFRCVADRLPAP